jgi:predicted ribosomally synthesized peptide with SipW-like signal peptide
MQTSRKVLLTVLVVGVVGSVVGLGAFSAFSSTTSNDNNTFTAGTVTIADNDAGAALYALTNQKPGVITDRCIKLTYSGSLDSDVKLYSSTVGGIGANYVNLTVSPGTVSGSPAFPSCTGFTSDGGAPLYSGVESAFPTSYATGIADNPGTVATKWATGDTVVYRFSTSVQDTNLAQGATTGTHSFTWEARNQ